MRVGLATRAPSRTMQRKPTVNRTMPSAAHPFLRYALMPLSSIGFLLRRPHLWWYVAVPMFINAVLMTLAFAFAPGLGYDAAKESLTEQLSGGIWEWLAPVAGVLAGAIALMVSVLLIYIVAIIIASPFSDLMGERIEKELLAARPHLIAPDQPLWKNIFYALLEALRRVAILIPMFAMLFAIGFVPFIGPVVSAVLGYLVTATFLSIDAFSFPMDRRHHPLRSKIEFLRAHGVASAGIGAGLALLAPLCCSPLFLPPLAAIAGSRVYCDILLSLDSAAPAAPIRKE